MKKNVLISGIALMCLLNVSPVLSQNNDSTTTIVNHPEKIKIPKDAPHEVKHEIDSLKRIIDAKYKDLLAPLEYEKDILTAKKRFALETLKAEEKLALAGIADSAREEREILKAKFRIQRDEIQAQFVQDEAPVKEEIEKLKLDKQNEINALILQYFPNAESDSLHHHDKPLKEKPVKDSTDKVGKHDMVSPNPSDGNGTITLKHFHEDELLSLTILDQQGNVKLTDTSDTGSFSFAGLTQGLYFYVVLDENGKKKAGGKIVVQ